MAKKMKRSRKQIAASLRNIKKAQKKNRSSKTKRKSKK